MKILFEKKHILLFVLIICVSFSLFAETIYRVEKGDTLYSISRKYQITVAELRAANNLSENDVIKIGQKLIIPVSNIANAATLSADNKKTENPVQENKKSSDTASAATSQNKSSENSSSKNSDSVYVIEKGDTLYGIAKKTGVSVAEIVALNNIDTTTVIKVGQKLKLKSAESSAQNTTSETSSKNSEKTTSVSTDNKSTTKDSSATATDKTDTKSNKEVTINVNGDDKAPDTRNYGTTVSADSTTVWPVKNPKVTTVKGKASGVQLSAQMNESVNCIREGTVMYVGVYRGFGQVVFVQSKTGVIYAYAGLGSVKVKKSDYVNYGAALGTAGIDSISGKPQITFMVFQNGQPIDPAKAPRN